MADFRDQSRELAVLVRVHGPDPKGRKMRHQAFFSTNSGDTALSASGVLLPAKLVMTCANLLEPFLLQGESERLVAGAEVHVLMQVSGTNEAKPSWVRAHLLALIDVPRSSEALQSLMASQGAEWEIGWNIVQWDGPQLVAGEDNENKNKGVWAGRSKEIVLDTVMEATSATAQATRIALLKLESSFEIPVSMSFSRTCQPGDRVKAVGSPFGAISPLHFFNSVSVGIISNCWPPLSSSVSLLMADIRCLPGMEGGPVFNSAGDFVGILLRPIRRRASGAEVQLMLPADCLIDNLREAGHWIGNVLCQKLEDATLKRSNRPGDWIAANPCLHEHVPSAVKQAKEAVVLVNVEGGSWASGVVLNRRGLILTNAHVLEPWRFVSNYKSGSSLPSYNSGSFRHEIRVRVDKSSQSWYSARQLFVSQGSLDIALLQINSPPADLRPITVEAKEPVPGSTAVVIGYGVFRPSTNLCASITAGVVSKVLRAGDVLEEGESTCDPNKPVMVQTTAAVHPGSSGGVLVNSAGHMIGLVTSHAKHKVTAIPHLNFSAACAMLETIFEYASTEDASLLKELNEKNEVVATVWALASTRKSLPFLEEGQKKGSRFANFIAERQAEFNFRSAVTPFHMRSSL